MEFLSQENRDSIPQEIKDHLEQYIKQLQQANDELKNLRERETINNGERKVQFFFS